VEVTSVVALILTLCGFLVPVQHRLHCWVLPDRFSEGRSRREVLLSQSLGLVPRWVIVGSTAIGCVGLVMLLALLATGNLVL
jgi:hypothetical protein